MSPRAKPRTTAERLPPALFALAAGSFALGATEFLPTALLPAISGDLRVTIARAGLLVSGYAFGVTVATPVLTALLAPLPRRRLLVGLLLLLVLTNVAAALAPGFAPLLAVRFVTAFSHGTYLAIAATVAARISPPERSTAAIAILFAGIFVAMATVVPLTNLLGDRIGWRVPFLGVAALAALAALAVARTLPEIAAEPPPAVRPRWVRLLTEPHVALAFGMTVVGYAAAFVVFPYLVPYLRGVVGLSPGATAWLLGSLGIAVSVGNLAGGRVVEGRLYGGIALLFALFGLVLLLFGAVAGSPAATVAAVLAFGVLMFSTGSGLQTLAIGQARRWTPGLEEVASGLNQSAFNLGVALGTVVGGAVIDSPLGLRATPWIGALVAALAVGLTLFARAFDRPRI